MTTTIESAFADFVSVMKDELPKNTTSVSVFINCGGAEYKINTRTPEQLKTQGISMKNLRGKWIKE